jgi:hypothetical protein
VGEEGEGDEGVGGVEAEGDTGEESELGVGGLDEGVGHVVVEGSVDAGPVAHDAALEVDEGGDAAASGPGDPAVEGVFGGLSPELEHDPEAFFEQVGPMDAGVSLDQPGEVLVLAGGEVLGVLP